MSRGARGPDPLFAEEMPRVTLRMPERQIDEIEALVDEGRYPNRSEAIRALCRRGMEVVR